MITNKKRLRTSIFKYKYNTYKVSYARFYCLAQPRFKPVIVYNDLVYIKHNIYKENKYKCGIYRWVNNTNNKSYVGKSINLTKRFASYFSIPYLKQKPTKIKRALLKYGHKSFTLEILEYCSIEKVIEREQYYLDLLKPEYNILKIAGSSLGYKHTRKTRNNNRKSRSKPP